MLDHNLTLKSDELFLVGNIETDGSRERATGLYVRDTRHLHRFRVTINGQRPEQLQVRLNDPAHATVNSANPLLTLADGTLFHPQQLLLEQRVGLDDALTLEVIVRNYGKSSVEVTLSIEMGADFRDLFDIRGFQRDRRGTCVPPQIDPQGVVFGYAGLDGAVAETEIRFDRDVVMTEAVETAGGGELVPRIPSMSAFVEQPALGDIPSVTASFAIRLAPGSTWDLTAAVTPRPANGPPIANSRARDDSQGVSIVTSDEQVNRVFRRCLSDLEALYTAFPHGPITAAGIPWFVAPFGRDSLIVGLQTLHLMPERAMGTLRMLAALQGEKVNQEREEEPGKILHEMRYGEMARLGEIPHTPYYGTVDATPLFAWLVAETAIWTGDSDFYRELKPHAEHALRWVELYGDLDGDGFVEYRSDEEGTGRLTNQVWKDSFDSLNHPDGSPCPGPIAAVEVQGYVYAAYARLAVAAAAFGEGEWANELRARAEAMRARVEDAFWLPKLGFYAQALDGDKRPVEAMSSNPGHLLMAALPSPVRARMVVERMRRPDMDSGWGVRTLSTGAPTYNPMSYHNGSVWPHDNSLIGAGCFAQGHAQDGNRLFRSLLDSAQTDSLFRLPELFCGFPREGVPDELPVRYPVSCSPQAWAAGSLLLLLRGALGMQVDPVSRRIRIEPSLPDWLSSVRIDGLSVLGLRGSVTVTRKGDGYRIGSEGLPLA